MKEFIDKLMERLEEYEQERLKMYDWQGQSATSDVIVIIKDIADEYRTCYKSCMECEAYNKEKHYCPKWCDVIKNTISELAEEYKGGWIPCSERLPEENVLDNGYVEPSNAVLVFTKYNSYKVSRYWGNRRNKRDYYDWVDIDYRENEVIAWKPIDIPAPYTEGE